MTTSVWRFGARLFTLAEIEDIAFRHGQDGIMFYPPSEWDEKKSAILALQEAYRAAYARGKAAWEAEYGPRN